MLEDYNKTTDELRDRILALIPSHPEILDMADAFDLFKVEGFECSDLQPSLLQAAFALRSAQQLYRESATASE